MYLNFKLVKFFFFLMLDNFKYKFWYFFINWFLDVDLINLIWFFILYYVKNKIYFIKFELIVFFIWMYFKESYMV